jgi:Carboxypeptidase regulatory-like domain
MRFSAASLVFSLTLLPAAAVAQGGTLRGVVRDSANHPLGNAEVVATPGPHRARTDSLGRFTMTGIGGGQYIVHGRKLGYSPGEATADLRDNGSLDVTLTLEHRMADLDTVVVSADGSCPERSVDGFLCRQKRGDKGVFMDYMDIDDKDPLSTADLFRDIPGCGVAVYWDLYAKLTSK